MTDLAYFKVVPLIANMPPIIAVRLPSGELSATLRSLCDLLDLSRAGQIQRIRRSSALATALQEVTISTPGGPQETEVLLTWAIASWAAGLHISRLPEAKRAAAVILQQSAFASIEQAFTESSRNTSPSEPLPAGPLPKEPLNSQSLSEVLAQAGDMIDARFKAIETSQASLSGFVSALVASLPAEMVAPSGTISPMRLTHLYALARRVRQVYGVPIVETLALLAEYFQVEDVSDLPTNAWSAVLDWFKGYLLMGYPPKA